MPLALLIVVLVVAGFSPSSAFGFDRYVTLTASRGQTNRLEILGDEFAEFVSFPAYYNQTDAGQAPVQIFINNRLVLERYPLQNLSETFPAVVAGPARIQLAGYSSRGSFCTVKVSSRFGSPTGTVVIPPGPGGAILGLESSTNLQSWSLSSPGVYTNDSTARFFRLKVARILGPVAGVSGSVTPVITDSVGDGRGVARNIVPWVVNKADGLVTNDIPDGAAIKVLSVLHMQTRFIIEKDGLNFFDVAYPDGQFMAAYPLVISGPARLKMSAGTNSAVYTLEFLSCCADPQTTVIVPPGAAGGRVQLQSSTNLSDWRSVELGTYTNLPAASFFRIALERLPK